MTTPSTSSPNDIYLLKAGLSQQQLTTSISRCLCQAEALAVLATIADIEAVGPETISITFGLSPALSKKRNDCMDI